MRDRLGSGSRWRVSSAGTHALPGMAASGASVAVMREWGLHLDAHHSQPVTVELIDSAAVVVVMTASHREELFLFFENSRGKVFLIKSFGPRPGDVGDPIGLSMDTYRKVRDEIAECLPGLISFLETLDV